MAETTLNELQLYMEQRVRVIRGQASGYELRAEETFGVHYVCGDCTRLFFSEINV